MKFLYKTMYSALLMGAMGLNATAQQQLPNSGFQEEWVNCVPFTATGSTRTQGTTPTDWCVSNVIGMSGMGATTVATNVEGYESTSATGLTNSPNPMSSSQIVPAYITLGTTWSTAKATITGKVSNSDGGSFGGHAFTDRPTGLQFMYKRSRGTAKPDEQSTIVAYLWKGHVTQVDVPCEISMSTPKKKDMVDRDRCVLDMDMTGCLGGAVTKDENFELIATLNTTITENADEWTKFSAKFDYKSEATPEMVNVILAAGDYFGGASVVGKDNSLTVDNVRVFYEYEDDLAIKMGAEATEDETIRSKAAIQIVPYGDGLCTFTLPNFTLTMGDEEMPLGDIVVDNVTITEKDGVNYYEGTVPVMELLDGMIKAHVSLSGTVEYMKIDVIWLAANEEDPTDPENIPIYVEFGKKADIPTGIINANVDNENEPVEFFNLQGFRVNGDNLTPGIYVRRQGSNVSKVLVK